MHVNRVACHGKAAAMKCLTAFFVEVISTQMNEASVPASGMDFGSCMTYLGAHTVFSHPSQGSRACRTGKDGNHTEPLSAAE